MRILFFDGYCNLCNGIVNWLISRTQDLKFAPLQGTTAQKTLPLAELPRGMDTVIYLRDGIVLKKSDAALAVLVDLGGPWKIIQILFILPKTLRDCFYDIIARNRYRLFSKRDSCRVPTDQETSRFLD